MTADHIASEITADTPFTPDDDTYHVPGTDDPYWVETNWWSFNVPQRHIGGWLHARYDVNRRTVTWRVFVWDPSGADLGRIAYYRNATDKPMPEDPDLRDITFPHGGFSVKMIEPLTRYHISYSDPANDFSISFEHRAVHPPRRFTPGEPPAMFSPHLDQLGHQVGELVLRGESIPIDSYSIRDRTWGPRGGHHMQSKKPEYLRGEYKVLHPGGPRWREIERERGRGRIQYIFGHSGPETGFLGFIRPQDGDAQGWSPMNHGWLLRDGQFERLDKTMSRMRNFRDPQTGWSSHMQVDLTDLTGRSMTAEGFSVSHMCEGGLGSNALMRWEFDGEIGWGEDQDGWKRSHWVKMMNALRATGTHEKES
ncbi:hypothetical protein IA539_20575 [Gordonia sp. zg691]|uniref:DUF7065 domain-containing protein n=1 Tax=Gordonia jinghuaiqii TaxID=2758710 RepID=A0A7D7LXE4_9ACTN|nr:hypothetical protein [Gordonia jinghuaiqii]MBD0863573.1 hypothetical protein [Gordonia jinghuaiqii]MCR5979309.1 hypothetical protein [Gordonia jinghuaiqii]QMT01094.1 hypothetical protein H1R19_19900 [Gordonia jinghuaiqii]